MNLGKRIKGIREEKNLTQQQIAEALGVSVHTISKYEQGQREPSLEVMSKIADILEVELFELMVDKDEVLKKWNVQLDNDQLSKETQLLELLQQLYPNDYDFIIDLFTRLGLFKTETGNDETI